MNWNQSNNNLFVLHISFWRMKHYGSGLSLFLVIQRFGTVYFFFSTDLWKGYCTNFYLRLKSVHVWRWWNSIKSGLYLFLFDVRYLIQRWFVIWCISIRLYILVWWQKKSTNWSFPKWDISTSLQIYWFMEGLSSSNIRSKI